MPFYGLSQGLCQQEASSQCLGSPPALHSVSWSMQAADAAPAEATERMLRAAERPAPALGKAGGAYIPPFKLAAMLKEAQDKESPEYQRLTWDALRKSINGLVNKVNISNIKHILPEFFQEVWRSIWYKQKFLLPLGSGVGWTGGGRSWVTL